MMASLQKRYDAALRDYKKGKFLLETKPGQLLPTPSTTSGSQSGSTSISDHQKQIFDKVWTAVEKVMNEFRSTLLGQLREISRPVEDQEKTIECVTQPRPSLRCI